ncbi:PREDICTED: trem-like transcript 1 protein isoform X2 [Cercocebus atys]|uniref:trem-like transcript 1 protein isoform X2 n=1 Tax=Cercocebus atys TaxID=9531 RepID=UPI0005F496BC|nr:PREDICTED: trem-like transcript 1 protein isoform X2 [Cercocebus atys]
MGSMNPCGWLEAVGPTLPHFPKWAASLLEPQVLPWQAQVAHPVSGGPSPWISRPDTDQLDGTMAPAFLLLLLLLLWPQGCVSGPSADSVYTKVRLVEGETLSVQCSYKGYKSRMDGKVWCKVRKKKCELGFARVWVKGPRYLLQDDAQAKVVNITMVALRLQDSGRYWCMRNTSGTLYPLMGIQLDVSPGKGESYHVYDDVQKEKTTGNAVSVPSQAQELTFLCPAMGPNLLLLLLLGLEGQGIVGSLPEVLQAPVGSSILVQCHYRLQDVKAQKVWCRFSPEGCQPLVSSAVDRRAPAGRRTFLTDLGGGLLQVEMVTLQEEDAGEYGCMVDGARGPQILHRVSLNILPPEDEEEIHKIGSLAENAFSDPAGSANPLEPSQDEKSIPLIWGAALLVGLLVAAVVLFAVMAKRKKGNRLGVSGRFLSSRVSGMNPSSVVHHVSDSGLAAELPLDVPHVRLDSPPSFDNTTYTSLPLDPPSGKPSLPAPSSLPPLPPKVLVCSKPVTYATVIFPGGNKGGGASCGPAQNPPNNQTPSS